MKVLVTGGGGFLGKAIVARLLEKGHSVRSFSRSDYPELRAMGVETQCGDLNNFTAVDAAVTDCDAVFHAGAKAGISLAYLPYYETNVLGTQNVLDACRRREVPKLVYTSSPSVAFAGGDQEGVDESEPYPAKYTAHYARTKAAAERLVLEANSPGLSTVTLRPHLIWGPGDTQLIPRILERARAGTMRIIGTGTSLIDATYIDNAAYAHLLAFERLAPEEACAGKAYYISNDEPMPFAEVVNSILDAAGLPPVEKHVSLRLAYVVGAVHEVLYRLQRRAGEPVMTRFAALQMGTAHWYNISAAKKDLGYTPIVSMREGMRCLADSLNDVSIEEQATA